MSAAHDAMGQPGAGSGGDAITAWNHVVRDVMAGLIPVSDVDDYYALYRQAQLHEQEQRRNPTVH